MDSQDLHESWVRVRDRIAQMPKGRGREVAWLAEKLKMRLQVVANWQWRGVPSRQVAEVASALRWSTNQVLGLKDPDAGWPFQTITPERLAALTPHQMAMVELAARMEIERVEAASGKRQETGT